MLHAQKIPSFGTRTKQDEVANHAGDHGPAAAAKNSVCCMYTVELHPRVERGYCVLLPSAENGERKVPRDSVLRW